jgi:hypothetical protein
LNRTAHTQGRDANVVIDRFRVLSEETGKGYQTSIKHCVRTSGFDGAPLTATALRRILREELGHHG